MVFDTLLHVLLYYMDLAKYCCIMFILKKSLWRWRYTQYFIEVCASNVFSPTNMPHQAVKLFIIVLT